MGKLENRSSAMSHHRLMTRIDTIKNDPRYEFMFRQASLGGDTMAAVLSQVFSLESEDQPLTILKLASLPDEVVDAVVCVLARLAFDFALWSDGAIPILLACEEAHRYASADQLSGFAPARRALKRIAREGRKYGVHLCLVTQRPAELDPTIISQCSTFFVDADDQRRRPGAAALGGLRGGGEPPRLRPLPRRPGGDRHRRGPAARRAHHLQHPAARGDPAERVRRPRRGRAAPLERGEIVRSAIERWRRATTSQSLRLDDDPARAEPAAPSALTLARPAQSGPSLSLRRS